HRAAARVGRDGARERGSSLPVGTGAAARRPRARSEEGVRHRGAPESTIPWRERQHAAATPGEELAADGQPFATEEAYSAASPGAFAAFATRGRSAAGPPAEAAAASAR